MNNFRLKEEIQNLLKIIRSMDRKIIIIFLSVAVLQTISWYYTSRNFFRLNIFPIYQNDPNVYLYEYLYWFIGDFLTLFVLSGTHYKICFKRRSPGLWFTSWRVKTRINSLGYFFSSNGDTDMVFLCYSFFL